MIPNQESNLIQQNYLHLFEEHSSTLPIWWAQHDSPRTVVYLDAHLDLQKTGEDSLAALKACNTLEEIQALETPNHLNPSVRYAFGIENFLYAAHQLKLIDRLVWVAPAHVPRQYSSTLIDYMQQMDGISFDELTSFQMAGRKAQRGTLLGLDIIICDYDDLDSLDIDENFYLDVDIDYFVHVPSDRLWIDPATVINTITAQLGNPSLVTISRGVSSGFVPMAFRFVGDYIYSLLSGQKTDFGYYQKLTSAILNRGDRYIELLQNTCKQLIKDQPELAAAHYILALSTADASEKNHLLYVANCCDNAYGFDLAREAIGLLHRKKSIDTNTLRHLATTLDKLDLEKPQLEQAEVALAKVLSASGNPEYALSLMANQTGDYADHEDVLLSISARQLKNPAKREQNKEMLSSVSNGVKNATIASVYLGDLEFADKHYQAALEHYISAHNRAPAWLLPLEHMLVCYKQLGMSEKASEVEDRIMRRQQHLDQIVS